MLYSQNGTLRAKVIRNSDVLAITEFFESLKHNGGKCTFCICYRDGSQIEDSSKAVFESNTFSRKSIKSMSFSYVDEVRCNILKLNLSEEVLLAQITNTYELFSVEETWYNATLAQITELIQTISKVGILRRAFYFPFSILSYLLTFCGSVAMMTCVFGFVHGTREESIEYNSVFISDALFFIVVNAVFAAIFAGVVFLYPDMDFDLGTPPNILRKKFRTAIAWIAGTVAIPILLSWIMG